MHDSSRPVKSRAKLKQSQILGEVARQDQNYPPASRLALLNLPCGKTIEPCIRYGFPVG